MYLYFRKSLSLIPTSNVISFEILYHLLSMLKLLDMPKIYLLPLQKKNLSSRDDQRM